MAHIGLVAEGAHDYLMLEPLLAKELQNRGHEEVTFARLQPQQDATGYYPGGGWTRVVAWCLDNAGENLQSVFTPPLEGALAVDAILIHLDGDAAEHIVSHTSIASPQPFAVVSRVRFITAAIEQWLDIPNTMRTKVIVAAPVMHTEAWLNAAISSFVAPYESADAKDALRARRDISASPTLASHYASCGQAAIQSIALIAQPCASYRLFQQEIVSSTL